MDLFLRFDDRQHAYDVMNQFVYDIDGEKILLPSTHQYSLYEVGHVLNTGGWHINLRVIDDTLDISYLEPYRVYPKSPRCVWA